MLPGAKSTKLKEVFQRQFSIAIFLSVHRNMDELEKYNYENLSAVRKREEKIFFPTFKNTLWDEDLMKINENKES